MVQRQDNLLTVASDKGCRHATEYLGEQSYCLDCPFPECVFDKPNRLRYWKESKKREDILMQLRQGSSVKELASLYGVSIVTVYSVLRRTADSGEEELQRT